MYHRLGASRYRPRHPLLRLLSRPVVYIPVILSIVVHAVLAFFVVSIRFELPRSTRLGETGHSTDTVLTFAKPTPPNNPPPKPTPKPDPKPEPKPPTPTPPPPPPPQPRPEPPPETPPETTENETLAQRRLAADLLKAARSAPQSPDAVPVPDGATRRPAAPNASPPQPLDDIPGTSASQRQSQDSRGPQPVSFAGVQTAKAGRVVYIINASGAMASSLPFVLTEVERSVSRLDSSQRFQVIVSRGTEVRAFAPAAPGRSIALAPGKPTHDRAALLEPDDSTRDALAQWLSTISPSGRADPLPCLTAAIALEPDLVFLLTRSIPRSGLKPKEVERLTTSTLAGLDRANPTRAGQRRVVIKTIQFLEDDPTGLLQAIAATHGDGPDSYRLVTLGEINATR